MKRPGWTFGIAAVVLATVGTILAPRRRPASTPPPSATEYLAFVRLLPIPFRPHIAALERGAPPRTPRPPLMAVGIEGGRTATISHRTRAVTGRTLSSQIRAYTAPYVPHGHLVETAYRYSADRTHDVQFVVSGAGRGVRFIDAREFEPLLADGESTLVDRGAIRNEDGNVLRAPGSAGDGEQVFVTGGPPLRRVALAPAELPPTTKAEPGGYALLFDVATLWRSRSPISSLSGSSVSGIGAYLPASWGIGHHRYAGREHEFRVTSLAHVYTRTNGRWRYARTWAIEGSGTAWIADDEPALAPFLRVRGKGAPAFGVPADMKAQTARLLQ